MNKKYSVCLLVAFFLSTFHVAIAQVRPPISGERVSLSQTPHWTISGAWSSGGDKLFLVDVLRNSILEYDAEGGLVETIANRGFDLPVLIHGAESGLFWIEDEDGRLLLVDEEMRTRQEVDLKKEVISPLGSLISVSGWAPLGASELVVFGDMRQGKESVGVVLRVPLDKPSKFEILREIPIESIAHRFFLIGQPYLAGVRGEAFFAIMGGDPEVFASDGRGMRGFRLIRKSETERQLLIAPHLPTRVTMSTTAPLFKQLEGAAYPAGIYGWKDSLFVLMRTPVSNGSLWTLLKIDPKTFGVVWDRRIDTQANHLVVVPGEKYWAFVEKGPVKGPGDQAVPSFLRVPSAIIDQ